MLRQATGKHTGGSYASMHLAPPAASTPPQTAKPEPRSEARQERPASQHYASPAANSRQSRPMWRSPKGSNGPTWQQQPPTAYETTPAARRSNGPSAYDIALMQQQQLLQQQQPPQQRRHTSRSPATRATYQGGPAQVRVLSPGPSSTASSTVGRADALSGEIFRTKLQAIMAVREQIEVLAAKHKTEEEALTSVLNSMRFEDEARRKTTHDELEAALMERDRTIEMLDTFRREGSAVIARMHDNLKRSAEQNEQAVRRIEQLSEENTRLREALRRNPQTTASAGAPGSPNGSMTSATLATSTNADATIAEYEKRSQTYAELLSDADEVIRQLREQNELLQRQLAAALANGGGNGGAAAAPSASSPEQASLTSPTRAGDAAGTELRKTVDELRDQLRGERRQRLQSEEQSQHILLEQQRHIDLLEQRLTQSQRSNAPGGTPRSARAHQSHGVARRGSGHTPTQPNMTPPATADDSQQETSTAPLSASEERWDVHNAEVRDALARTPVKEGNAATAAPSPSLQPLERHKLEESADSPTATQSPLDVGAPADASSKRDDSMRSGGTGGEETEDEEHTASMNRILDLQQQLLTLQASMEGTA
jgi:hypothetical protein